MGTIKKGILGGFKGKVGSLVGRTTKDKAVITSLNTTPKKTKSVKQLEIEKALGQCRGLAGYVYEEILVYLISISSQKTTILSEFIKRNFVLFNNQPKPIYSLIDFSVGYLLTTPIKTLRLSTQHQRMQVTWSQNWVTGSIEENDLVYVVIINDITEEVFYSSAIALRKDKSVDVSLVVIAPDTQYHCYLMFNRNSNKIVSNTSYKKNF